MQLDLGEREAIALAQKLHADTLIVDDEAGRTFALSIGLNVTGTLGIILLAKTNGYLAEIKPTIERLCQETTFRISVALKPKF